MATNVLASRYHLLETIGRGAAAQVHKAMDTRLDRLVAIKILHDIHAGDADFARRFEHEAKTIAKLSHPHIVDVYDYDEAEGHPFIVMEYVSGPDLKRWLSEHAPLSAEESRRLISQVLQGLAAAHRAGLVHRDVKPHNVLIAPDGTVKVSDFGIAKTSSGAGLTHTGTILGTPHYLAPEVAQGEAATPQSDLYAVGVMLYEMLSGRLPFEGDSAISIVHAHIFEEPPPLGQVAPNVSPRMASVVELAMAKPPEDRYASADEMLEDLSTAARAESRSAAPGRGGALATTVGLPALPGRADVRRGPAAPVVGRATPPAQRRRAWPRWALLLPLLLFLFGGGAWLIDALGQEPGSESALVNVSPTATQSGGLSGAVTRTPETVAGAGRGATPASTATAEGAGDARVAAGTPTDGPTDSPTSAPPTASAASRATDTAATDPSPTPTATTPPQPTATPRPPATATSAPTATPVQTATEATDREQGEGELTLYASSPAGDGANLRQRPAQESLVLLAVPPGESVRVMGPTLRDADGREWRKATYEGQTGYVSNNLLRPTRRAALTNSYTSPANSGGTLFRGNLQRTGVYQTTAVDELQGLKWRFQTGGGVSRGATVALGIVYFGSVDTYFYAVDTETGTLKWRYKTESIPSAPPAVAGRLVYFGSDDGYVYAVDRETGRLRWKFQTGSRVPSGPAVSGGVVYFGSWDTYMYAVDALSGEELWSFKTDGKIASSPAISGGTVYFGSDDTYLYAVDLETRQLRWRFKTGRRVYSSPAVSGGTIYVGSADRYLYAVEAGSGDLRWSFRTGGRISSSPAVSGSTVYFGSDDGFLYAADAGSGQQRWAFDTGKSVFSSPTVAGDTVYFGSNNGSIYAADAATGERRWEYGTGGAVQSTPAVDGGAVYVGSLDGNLYALR